MNAKLLFAGLFGLSVLLSPLACAQGDDAEPSDVTAADGDSKAKDKKKDKKAAKPATEVGRKLAEVEFLNENTPNPKAKYFMYLSSASWCGPCQALKPKIVAAYKKMKADKVELILVCNDNSEEEGKEYASHYPCPAVMAGQGSTLPGFTPSSTLPNVQIVDGKGNVLLNDHGNKALEYKDYLKKGKKKGGK